VDMLNVLPGVLNINKMRGL